MTAIGPVSVERRYDRLGDRVRARSAAVWRLPWRARFALLGIAILVVLALISPQIVPYPPDMIGVGPVSAPPSSAHLFGTDEQARDVFSRVLVGTQVSAIVALVTPLIALLVGGLLACIATTCGKWPDEIIMRALDIQLAFPAVILALVLATVIGPSLTTSLILLSVVYTPIVARFLRGAILKELAEDYVTAERVIGTSTPRILLRHVSLNVATPVLVFLMLVAADAVVLEAALSFLGASVRPPTPTWGGMIQDGQTILLTGAWWATVWPGVAIFLMVLSLSTVAETLADKISGRQFLLARG
jgi:peptide/nickel transport system permease protein